MVVAVDSIIHGIFTDFSREIWKNARQNFFAFTCNMVNWNLTWENEYEEELRAVGCDGYDGGGTRMFRRGIGTEKNNG